MKLKRENRKHKYLVGYRGEKQVAYDMMTEKFIRHYVEPLTLYQARRAVKHLASDDVDRIVYELVPAEITSTRKPKKKSQ